MIRQKDTGSTDRALLNLDASNILQIGAATGIASAHINNSTQIDSLGVGVAASGTAGEVKATYLHASQLYADAQLFLPSTLTIQDVGSFKLKLPEGCSVAGFLP